MWSLWGIFQLLRAEDLLTDLIGVYKQLSQEDTQDIVTSTTCDKQGMGSEF